jgi:hypothetical protein
MYVGFKRARKYKKHFLEIVTAQTKKKYEGNLKIHSPACPHTYQEGLDKHAE